VNKLSDDERSRIVGALVEGGSMRAVSRMTGTARNTINKLLVELCAACSTYQDKVFRNLPCRRIQCHEIWSFVGAKEKNASAERKAQGWGDVWTWVALDADTKLVPCWFVGTRDAGAAYHLIHDLAGRLDIRIQLTSGGRRVYLNAVEYAFGADVDYAQLVKLYGAAPEGPEVRYSPAQWIGARKALITGKSEFADVSTSFVERQTLTRPMSMKRFAGLSNGFSKKVENHENMLALHYMYYNFCRIHQTLNVTPAMEAGIADHVWKIEEIIALLN
jgi:hypothetical protein